VGNFGIAGGLIELATPADMEVVPAVSAIAWPLAELGENAQASARAAPGMSATDFKNGQICNAGIGQDPLKLTRSLLIAVKVKQECYQSLPLQVAQLPFCFVRLAKERCLRAPQRRQRFGI
jgi:hypothetical protein